MEPPPFLASTPPRMPCGRPSLRAPLITWLASLAAAIGLSIIFFALAWPHFAAVFAELGSEGLAQPEAMQAALEGVLAPGMFLLSLPIILASTVHGFAGIWLLVVIILRLTRR